MVELFDTFEPKRPSQADHLRRLSGDDVNRKAEEVLRIWVATYGTILRRVSVPGSHARARVKCSDGADPLKEPAVERHKWTEQTVGRGFNAHVQNLPAGLGSSV